MRVFQVVNIYVAHLSQLRPAIAEAKSDEDAHRVIQAWLGGRLAAPSFLHAMIEKSGAEVFHLINFTHYSADFLRRLLSCVQHRFGLLGSADVGTNQTGISNARCGRLVPTGHIITARPISFSMDA
jgi:hypothetical protein